MTTSLKSRGDDGQINQRLLAREAKTDYLARIESVRRLIPATFSSPEAKRLFLRFFDSMQMNTHFISVIARTRLPDEAIERIEAQLQQQLSGFTEELNQAIDSGHTLLQAHGITSLGQYEVLPLQLDVRVTSSLGRRYLELLLKVDQLMPILETLAIDEVITQRELQLRKGLYKNMVKQVGYGVRRLAGGIRARMYANGGEGGKVGPTDTAERSPVNREAIRAVAEAEVAGFAEDAKGDTAITHTSRRKRGTPPSARAVMAAPGSDGAGV